MLIYSVQRKSLPFFKHRCQHADRRNKLWSLLSLETLISYSRVSIGVQGNDAWFALIIIRRPMFGVSAREWGNSTSKDKQSDREMFYKAEEEWMKMWKCVFFKFYGLNNIHLVLYESSPLHTFLKVRTSTCRDLKSDIPKTSWPPNETWITENELQEQHSLILLALFQ